MAHVIKTDGTIQQLPPGKLGLPTLQKAVGGYIEIVSLDRTTGSILVCNEDGKMLGLPVNEVATRLLRAAPDSKGRVYEFDTVVGDVIVAFAPSEVD